MLFLDIDACSLRMLLISAVVSGRQPDGKSPEPPTYRIETTASSNIFHLPLLSPSNRCRVFGMVGRKRRGQVSQPVLMFLFARKLASPDKHEIQQPLLSKLGR